MPSRANDRTAGEAHQKPTGLPASTSGMRSSTLCTQGIAQFRGDERVVLIQNFITHSGSFLHCSHPPQNRRSRRHKASAASRIPSTRAIMSYCFGDGNFAHSCPMSAIPLARRLSPGTSKESRRQGKRRERAACNQTRLVNRGIALLHTQPSEPILRQKLSM